MERVKDGLFSLLPWDMMIYTSVFMDVPSILRLAMTSKGLYEFYMSASKKTNQLWRYWGWVNSMLPRNTLVSNARLRCLSLYRRAERDKAEIRKGLISEKDLILADHETAAVEELFYAKKMPQNLTELKWAGAFSGRFCPYKDARTGLTSEKHYTNNLRELQTRLFRGEITKKELEENFQEGYLKSRRGEINDAYRHSPCADSDDILYMAETSLAEPIIDYDLCYDDPEIAADKLVEESRVEIAVENLIRLIDAPYEMHVAEVVCYGHALIGMGRMMATHGPIGGFATLVPSEIMRQRRIDRLAWEAEHGL